MSHRRRCLLIALTFGLLHAEARADECRVVPSVATLGGGTSGTQGFPTLSLNTAPQLDSAFLPLHVASGPASAGAEGVLLVGSTAVAQALPTYGATLYPGGPLRAVPFTLDASGQAEVDPSALVTAGQQQCGQLLVLQAALEDPLAQGGYAFTAALEVRIGRAAQAPMFHGPRFATDGARGALSDVDRDRFVDLVAVTDDGRVRVHPGEPGGVFGDPRPLLRTGLARDVVACDLDLDGDDDLVVANDAPGSLSVLINDGRGGFSHTLLPIGNGPVGRLGCGDFDGDGHPDLAATSGNLSETTLVVFRGDGSGAFGATTSRRLLGSVVALEVSDLDGDGRSDLALAYSGVSQTGAFADFVRVLLGRPDGGFDEGPETHLVTLNPPFPPFAMTPHSLAAGDIDGDGVADLAVGASFVAGIGANVNTSLVILLGEGDGAFVESSRHVVGNVAYPGQQASDLVLDDLDGDGALDIVAANGLPGPATYLLGSGDGQFQPQVPLENTGAPYRVLTSSLEPGAAVDVVALDLSGLPSPVSGFATVTRGTGDGDFEEAALLPTEDAPLALALADLDGDGHVDVLVADDTGSGGMDDSLRVSLGAGDASPTLHGVTAVGSQPAALVVADLDADGALDVATANADTDDVSVLLGDGRGGFSLRLDAPTGVSPRALACADLDGDGVLDLLTANRDSDDVTLLRGLGDGHLEAPQVVVHQADAAPRTLAAGDLDGDADIDLVVGFEREQVVVLLNLGDGTFAPGQVLDVGPLSFVNDLELADVDADGVLDVVVAAWVHDHMLGALLWSGLGDGGFAEPVELLAPRGAFSVECADMDADGRVDLVFGTDNASLTVLLSQANGSFAAPSVFRGGAVSDSLALGDLDGDGVIDAAQLTRNDDGVLLFLNQLFAMP